MGGAASSVPGLPHENISIPYDSIIDVANNNGTFSLFAWVKRNLIFHIFYQMGVGRTWLWATGPGLMTNITDSNNGIQIGEVRMSDWEHVGIVHNGTHLIGYTNGTEQTFYIQERTQNIDADSTADYKIGLTPDKWNISELYLWNRPLSAEEVTYLFNMGNTTGCH